MILSADPFSLRPTQHGVLFVFILGAMLVGAVNYNNNAGFVLVFLLGGMLLISFIYTLRNINGLGLYFMPPRPVFAGEEIAFPIRIMSGDRDRNAIGVGSAGARLVFVTLPRGRDELVELRMPAPERGQMRLESVAVFSVFPLGLFRIRLRVAPGVEGLVYPEQIPGEFVTGSGGEQDNAGSDAPQSEPEGPGGLGVDDFQGLVPWQQGMPRTRIAWKAYSGGRGLFIKDFSSAGQESMDLDYHALPEGGREFRLSRLSHMVVTAHSQGRLFGLNLPNGRIDPPSAGGDQSPLDHLENCLTALALYPREEAP